jgi:hypothetical protein
MTGYFTEGKLKLVHVVGNAKTIYFVEEEKENDSTLIINRQGMARMLSGELKVALDSGEVTRVTHIGEPDGVFYDMNKIPEKEMKTESFRWEIEKKPIDPMSIRKKALAIFEKQEEDKIHLAHLYNQLNKSIKERANAEIIALNEKDNEENIKQLYKNYQKVSKEKKRIHNKVSVSNYHEKNNTQIKDFRKRNYETLKSYVYTCKDRVMMQGWSIDKIQLKLMEDGKLSTIRLK